MREVAKFAGCFVCGEDNSAGLRARFFAAADGTVLSTYVAEERFVGYAGILHGGVLAALLDEVMIKAILKDDILAVTASMEVKFKKPVRVGQEIKLIGKVAQNHGRAFRTEGRALVEGEEVASATGVYMAARGPLADELMGSLDRT
jgi:uncharacterized protein (TIGR00369 family)